MDQMISNIEVREAERLFLTHFNLESSDSLNMEELLSFQTQLFQCLHKPKPALQLREKYAFSCYLLSKKHLQNQDYKRALKALDFGRIFLFFF